MNPSTRLLAPTFLFRFSIPCRSVKDIRCKEASELPGECLIPSFAELEGRPPFAELRLGWSPAGLALSLQVRGKRQPPWCRDSRLDDSDGLRLLLDTRDTQSIHRASRFCHQFMFLPVGAGRTQSDPIAAWVPIARAKENPRSIPRDALSISAVRRVDGYLLRASIAASALTGYDPSEHPRLGFFFAIVDRELGWQTLTLGPEFPVLSDPSLWSSLELSS
ncbi:MAG TPA: hypothetical protein VIY86_10505 [Pirellulaceae bacterium]